MAPSHGDKNVRIRISYLNSKTSTVSKNFDLQYFSFELLLMFIGPTLLFRQRPLISNVVDLRCTVAVALALDIDFDLSDGSLGNRGLLSTLKDQNIWRRFGKPRDLDMTRHGRVVRSKSNRF